MKNYLVTAFFAIALGLLILVGGMYLWRSFTGPPTVITTTKWFDKSMYIPPKVVTLPGEPILVIDTARSNREDSLITELKKRDRLDSLARWRGQRYEVTFHDTLDVVDTTGSFYTREVHNVVVDGATQLVRKTTSYLDTKLRTSRTETTITEKSFDFLVAGLILLGGIIIGLLTSL